MDKDRQWFKAKCGLSVCETSRDLAFCAHAILQKESSVFLVPDATKDGRFMNSDLVLGPPHIRFYAGAPLEYTDEKNNHFKLGTLCIIDTKPREMTAEQLMILKVLARLVVAEIQLRENMAKANEQALATAHAGATSKARGLNAQYISQVAHDLRTPLNSFLLGMQAMRDTNLTGEQDAVLSTMEVSGQLMHLTCTKALDHMKLEVGNGLGAEHKLFNLVEMLDKSVTVVMGYTHESKEVEYEYILDDEVSAHIISDQDFVWQMYMNILCNARKFTTAGYIHTRLSVVKAPWLLEGALPKYEKKEDMPADEDDDLPFLKFSVSDTGIGVPDDQKNKLFQPFGQLQEFSGGTGLGLWSVLEKVKVLGGRCGMFRNEPQGSVFWFAIPYVPSRGPPRKGSWLTMRRSSSKRLEIGQDIIPAARDGHSPEQRSLASVTLSDETDKGTGEDGMNEEESNELWLKKRRTRMLDSKQTNTDSFRSIRQLNRRSEPDECEDGEDLEAQSTTLVGATTSPKDLQTGSKCTGSVVQTWLQEMGASDSVMKTFYEEGIDVEALSASTRQDLITLGVKQYGLQTKLLARAMREQRALERHLASHSSSASSLGHSSSYRTIRALGAKSHGSSMVSTATTHNASTETFLSLGHDASTASITRARAAPLRAGAHEAGAAGGGAPPDGALIAGSPPAAVDSIPAAAAAGSVAKTNSVSAAKEILIIEDDVPTRALMVHGLKKRGYVVHQAGNGADGLEMMKARTFDMVLSDIMMPVMDGIECAKRLRAWEAQEGSARPKQFVCALSANSGPSDVEKVKAAGIDDFFPKPVKIGQLMAHLEGKFMQPAQVEGDA